MQKNKKFMLQSEINELLVKHAKLGKDIKTKRWRCSFLDQAKRLNF